MPKPPLNLRDFQSLVEIVQTLRGPDGCPWDKEQTHQTLTRYAIEEAHELAEAIDSEQDDQIKDELGDFLFQALLHSEIAKQNNKYDIFDVIENLNQKMVRRHPHVFAERSARNSEEVLSQWQEIKNKEKAKKDTSQQSFDIPVDMPALMRSQKIGEKTHKLNFDWQNSDEVWKKVEEEILELKEALNEKNHQNSVEELGDLLFSLAQLARHLNTDCEQALRKANQKFEKRFYSMKQQIEMDQLQLLDLSAEQMETYWQKAKAALK